MGTTIVKKLDEIMEVLPEDHALQSILKDNKSSVMYAPPEMKSFWISEIAGNLERLIGEPKEDWEKKVQEIWIREEENKEENKETKAIWKYQLFERLSTIEMPKGAEILTVQVQHGIPCLWALVDPKAEVVNRTFRIFGTGHEIERTDILEYIGTYQVEAGTFIYHVFEVKW